MEHNGSEEKNVIARLLVKHWTVGQVHKTPEQEERERWLLLYVRGIPFNRWMLFPSAFLIQFCCGSLYSWSNFNAPIDILIYGTKTADKAPNTFYIAVGMFGTTAMILGPWLERNGPRKGLLLGSTVFAIGNAVTAISLKYKSIVGVYIGYGVLGGFGLGLNYISPVSALQKFFPDFRGVASGFAVAGFGAGSTVWSKVYLPLINAYKLPWTFGILAIILSGTMIICATVMRTPPNNFDAGGVNICAEDIADQGLKTRNGEFVSTMESQNNIEHKVDHESGVRNDLQMSLISSMFSPDFFFMYLMFFANQIFGLVALSRLANMCEDLFNQTAGAAANVVSVNGVFNCLGRLILPMMADLAIRGLHVNPPFARKCVYICTLCIQAVIVGILPKLIHSRNYGGFRGVMWTLTFAYGGGFGTIPCFLTDMFGPYNIGALHGLILTAWSIGGVGGGLGFTSIFDHHKPATIPKGQKYAVGAFDEAYTANLKWILAVVIVGFVMLQFVRTNPKDRTSPGWRYSIFGKKIVHIAPNKSHKQPNSMPAVGRSLSAVSSSFDEP